MNSHEQQTRHDQLLSRIANLEQQFKDTKTANACKEDLLKVEHQIKMLEHELTTLRIEMYYL
jgi:hypothetical protein